jgi:hypothetical protein
VVRGQRARQIGRGKRRQAADKRCDHGEQHGDLEDEWAIGRGCGYRVRVRVEGEDGREIVGPSFRPS